MEATGWQAHSVRGFLSGIIRKKMAIDVRHIAFERRRAIRHWHSGKPHVVLQDDRLPTQLPFAGPLDAVLVIPGVIAILVAGRPVSSYRRKANRSRRTLDRESVRDLGQAGSLSEMAAESVKRKVAVFIVCEQSDLLITSQKSSSGKLPLCGTISDIFGNGMPRIDR